MKTILVDDLMPTPTPLPDAIEDLSARATLLATAGVIGARAGDMHRAGNQADARSLNELENDLRALVSRDALAQGERERVIEECARVCKKVRDWWVRGAAETPYGQGFQSACDHVESEIRALALATAERSGAPASEWRPIDPDTPEGKWLVTYREGERMFTLSMLRRWADGEDDEWMAQDGATTVTHHSYAPPTHWWTGLIGPLPAPPSPSSAGGRS